MTITIPSLLCLQQLPYEKFSQLGSLLGYWGPKIGPYYRTLLMLLHSARGPDAGATSRTRTA